MGNMHYLFLTFSIICALLGVAFVAYGLSGLVSYAKTGRTVKAILRCTNCWNDLQVVTRCLINQGLVIKKTKMGSSIYPELTVQADSMYHLSSAVDRANAVSSYGVTVLKIKAQ